MGERKVLNKYYSPDFDPAKLSRSHQAKNRQMKVRMMLPIRSITCNTCHHYIYAGTKFNARKEEIVNEDYLGIKIYMFYFKCTNCSAEILIKTDPANSDYIVESGARRSYDNREAEETSEATESLEKRILKSKREMEITSALEEVKSMNSRRKSVGLDAMLGALQTTNEEKKEKMEDEDEALIKSIFQKPRGIIRKIDDDELDKGEPFINQLKRKKLSEDVPNNNADYQVKGCNGSANEEKPTGTVTKDNRKFIFKSPIVVKSVKRKEENIKANSGNSGMRFLSQICYSND